MTRTACLNAIYELAKKDERVVFIGSDLSPNTLSDFKRDFPDRFFMEGVQEQNIIGMAVGLALEGFIPYVNTIATFLTRRCYEQIAIDVCAHNLPVRLIGNGGGLVYAPLGLTHCAIEDIAIMRALPNMMVVNCADSEEMKEFMKTTLNYSSPIYIRLGKDSDPVLQFNQFISFPVHKVLVIGTGYMSSLALKTFDILNKDNPVADFRHIQCIKPLGLHGVLDYQLIVTMEEGIINGALGSAVLEYISDNNLKIPVRRFGLPDVFPHHYGERDDLLEIYSLTPEKMAVEIMKCLRNL